MIAIVLTTMTLAACGGGGEDSGSSTSRRESTTTTGETTTTGLPEPTTTAVIPAGPTSPQEEALLAEAAGLFADQPGRDQEILDQSRSMCAALDEAVAVGSSFLPTVVLGSMFRSVGEDVGATLAGLAARHLCPQHTATVDAFVTSYDPSGPLPGALPAPG